MLLLFLACARTPTPVDPPLAAPPAAAPAPLPAAAPPDPPSAPPPGPPAFHAEARPLTDAERAAMTGPVWREGCPVGLDALRRLEVTHWRPDGTTATGAVVVAAEAVDPLTAAFHALWDQHFPIERMEPIEAYGGKDGPSMEANNTSAFNCRDIKDTNLISRHAYGTAIDVNPLWNPWVKVNPARPDGLSVDPEAGRPWADRTRTDPGLFHADSDAVRAFTDAGWKWGGAWTDKQDYQHFSADGR